MQWEFEFSTTCHLMINKLCLDCQVQVHEDINARLLNQDSTFHVCGPIAQTDRAIGFYPLNSRSTRDGTTSSWARSAANSAALS